MTNKLLSFIALGIFLVACDGKKEEKKVEETKTVHTIKSEGGKADEVKASETPPVKEAHKTEEHTVEHKAS